MKEQIITFDTAKLAKEKGFNTYNESGSYNNEGSLMYKIESDHENIKSYGLIPAPTQSLLQKWLREKHEIHIEVKNDVVIGSTDVVHHSITIVDGRFKNRFYPCWNICDLNYEEALEKGLQKALKLI